MPPFSFKNALGATLTTKAGPQATDAVLCGKEYVLLYFSASWCPPCQQFTPELMKFYAAHKDAKKFEIVFVSLCKDKKAAEEYYAKMPWAMIPYDAAERKAIAAPGKYIGEGIPDLCILSNPRGDVVAKHVVEKVMEDASAAKFPWPAPGYVQPFKGSGRTLGGTSSDKKSAEFNTGNGQAVVYADADDANAEQNDFIARARAAGAVSMDEDRKRQDQKFTGTGRRLGNSVGELSVAADPGVPSAMARTDKPQEVSVKVTVFKDGFSIDDGDLLPQDAPEVKDILEGRVPKSILVKLREEYKDQKELPEVVIHIEDKKEENYKKTFKAFAGGGRSLGGAAAASSSSSAPAPGGAHALPSPVDDTKEVTSVQITMPDGSRIPGRFNLDHKVADIYAFVRHAKAGVANFTLMTTFPRQELKDESLTLKAAGLARAVVIVKPQ